ncbi:MAG: hypothetical protein M0Q51_17310 [Bacteroidales bacterium]|nr:hypothetical protein [Bacteroidales bacterium]
MNIFSGIFGPQDPEKQKNNKFQELETLFAGDQEMMSFSKSSWLTSRGGYYGGQGKLDQAIMDFKDAIILKPDHIPSYIALGIAYREKGMLQDALATLNKAPHVMIISGKELGGSEFDLYNAIASIYLLMGDKSKTIEYAKKAIEALNDPERKEQLAFAKESGVISEKENDDSKMLEVLKGLILELEGE